MHVNSLRVTRPVAQFLIDAGVEQHFPSTSWCGGALHAAFHRAVFASALVQC